MFHASFQRDVISMIDIPVQLTHRLSEMHQNLCWIDEQNPKFTNNHCNYVIGERLQFTPGIFGTDPKTIN